MEETKEFVKVGRGLYERYEEGLHELPNIDSKEYKLMCGKSFLDNLDKALEIVPIRPMKTEKPPIKTGRSFYLDINKINDIRKFRKTRK